MQYRRKMKASLLLSVMVACAAIAVAQPAPQPGSRNGAAFATPPLPKTALGQKAALMGSLASKWASVPDVEGTGPFPASYEAAPNGSDYVIYQPIDLAAAEAKGKLGVYVWGSGGCSPDAASSRFHLTEIASHGYVVIVPGKILSGPKAPPKPVGASLGMPDQIGRAHV